MKKATEAPDVAETIDGDATEAAKKGGFFRSLFAFVTLPFRIVAGIVRALVRVLGFAIATLLLPIRVAIALIRRIVSLASDITFALWRLVLKLVGFVLGIVKFFFAVLNATIGGAIRLVFRIIRRSLKLILGAFLIGNRVGKRSAKATAKATDTLDIAA